MYRVKQLWWALSARPLSAEKWALVQSVLSSAEFGLFQTLSNNEQQHGVRVLTTLLHNNSEHPALLKAALLHDCGKALTRPSTFERCLIVILSKLVPDAAKRWGTDTTEPYGWRRVLVTKEQHPAWGADRVLAMGSDSTTVQLVRWHQSEISDAPAAIQSLLQQLQWADDQN